MKFLHPLVALLFLSACATAPNGHSPLLRPDWQPAPEQVCRTMDAPAQLPAPEQLIDASAAAALLKDAPRPNGAPGYAVLEVAFDSTGAKARAEILESTLPEHLQPALAQTVALRAPASGSSGGSWGALLRVDADAPPALQIGRMEYCACALMNRREIARLLEAAAQRVQTPRLAGTQHTIVVEVRSDRRGTIQEVRLQQVSRHEAVNRVAAEVIPHMRIAPPLLNRRPLEWWSRIPITFVFPASGP